MIRWFHQCPLCPKVITKSDRFHAEQAIRTHHRKVHHQDSYEYEIARQELAVDDGKAKPHNG